MPFNEITELGSTDPISTNLFLFPDVTGNSIGLMHLGKELQTTTNNTSRIYVWHDLAVSPNTNSPTQNPLDQHAEEIAGQMMQLQPEGPFYLGGYSWGSILASVVSQKLQAAGRLVAFYGIDSPSISGSQVYLKAFNLAATHDLIAIFRYVGDLATLYSSGENPTPVVLELKTQEIHHLSSQPFETQIIFLQEKFSAAIQDQGVKALFDSYSATVIRNLFSLLQYPSRFDHPPLPRIGLFFSDESRRKYHFDVEKSWSSSGYPCSTYYLDNSDHLSLIRNRQFCRIIANAMTVFFDSYFSATDKLSPNSLPSDLADEALDISGSIKEEEMKISIDSDPSEGPLTPPASPRQTSQSFFTPPGSPRFTHSDSSDTLPPYAPSSRRSSISCLFRPSSPFTPSISPPPYTSHSPRVSELDSYTSDSSLDSSSESSFHPPHRGRSRAITIPTTPTRSQTQTPPLARSAPNSFDFWNNQPKTGRKKHISPAPAFFPAPIPIGSRPNTRRQEKQKSAALQGSMGDQTTPSQLKPMIPGKFGY